MSNEPRLSEVVDLLMHLASGDFRKRGEVETTDSDVDALIAGLNMLGEELEAKTVSRDFLDSVFRAVPDMLFVLDENFAIYRVNTAVTTSLGYEEADVSHATMRDFLLNPDQGNASVILRTLSQGAQCYNIETRFVTKDNKALPVSVSVAVARFIEGKTGYILLGKDISELKQTQRTLEIRNRNLETLIYRLTHDLRGPVASIMSVSELARLENRDADHSYWELVRSKTDEVNRILEALLTYSRIRNLDLSYASINWPNFLHEVKSSFETLLESSGVIWTQDLEKAPKECRTDQNVLSHVLFALVDNAVRYRSDAVRQPFVAIRVYVSGGTTIIEVEDNGIGIRARDRANIYEIFQRFDKRSKGSGMGLFIAQAGIERLGGTIELLDKDNPAGSTFRLTLPCHPDS